MKITVCRLMSTKELIAQTDGGYGYEPASLNRLKGQKQAANTKRGNKAKKTAKGRY